MSNFYPLTVTNIIQETSEAVSLEFDMPEAFYEDFNYYPGQYLTLCFNIQGEAVRRSYSLSSSPWLEEPLKVTVKRVKDGLVSNHIHDTVKIGDTINVLAPEGRFYATIDKEQYKTYYLFCAGSGVTPMLSILKSVLYTEPHSYVYMIYGNKDQNTIIFDETLKDLVKTFETRFVLIHCLSRPASSWSDFWNSKSTKGFKKGRVDTKMVEWFINAYPPYAQNAEYYICGPGTMIRNTEQALKQIDVPNDRIFKEHFGADKGDNTITGVADAQLIAHLDQQRITLTIPEGQTLLKALVNKGQNPPYSCEAGVCGSCKCKLKKGEVHMKQNLALEDDEVKAGYILSCQSIALTDTVEITY